MRVRRREWRRAQCRLIHEAITGLIAYQLMSAIHHPTHDVLEEYAMSRLSRSALMYSYFGNRKLHTQVQLSAAQPARQWYLQSFFRNPGVQVLQSIDMHGTALVKQYRCKDAQDGVDKHGYGWASRYEFEQMKEDYELI